MNSKSSNHISWIDSTIEVVCHEIDHCTVRTQTHVCTVYGVHICRFHLFSFSVHPLFESTMKKYSSIKWAVSFHLFVSVHIAWNSKRCSIHTKWKTIKKYFYQEVCSQFICDFSIFYLVLEPKNIQIIFISFRYICSIRSMCDSPFTAKKWMRMTFFYMFFFLSHKILFMKSCSIHSNQQNPWNMNFIQSVWNSILTITDRSASNNDQLLNWNEKQTGGTAQKYESGQQQTKERMDEWMIERRREWGRLLWLLVVAYIMRLCVHFNVN